MRIIALDPGITTGYAVFRRQDPAAEWETAEVAEDDGHAFESIHFEQLTGGVEDVWCRVLNFWTPDILIYEDFVYQRRNKVELHPVEVIGVIKLYAALNEVPLFHHTAGTVMRFCSDDKLKVLGWYKPGMPHANDAARHLLYHLVVTRKERKWLSRPT